MECNLGLSNLHDSRGIPPEASCHSPFADQTCQDYHEVCYMGPDFRRNPHEVFHDHLQAPPVHPHTHHMHGGILREIEKEIITEEIIMAEIARKRALEAEVRMIERQLTFLRRDRPFSFHPSPQMNHDLPTRLPLSVAEANWSSLEERLSALLEETKRMNGRHENALPLHGGMEGLGNQETKCFDQGTKDNKNIIFPAKKGGNISGFEVGPSVLPKTDSEKRNNRDEWSCALCEVTASSEETLNEHLHEKKHKLNIDSLRRENARKKYNIGLLPKTAIKSSTIIKTVDPPAEQEAKVTTEYFFSKEPNKAYAKKDENVSVSRKTHLGPSEVGANELPRTDTKKNNIEQWSCGLCGINASCEQNLNAHLHGKKHQLKLDDLRLVNYRKNCFLPTKTTKSATIIGNADRQKHTTKAKTPYTSGKSRIALAANEVASNDRNKWSCALCKVNHTSEQALIGHLHGKKHKLKLDDFRSESAQKNCSAGLFPKKATKSATTTGSVNPPAEQESKVATEYFVANDTKKAETRKQDSPLQPGNRTQQPEVYWAKKVDICGTRSMAVAAHEVASIGLPEIYNPTRNVKDEWSFAIHEVSAITEEVLNKDIVDKGKLEASRSENAQKKCFLPENDTTSTTMIENVDPHAEQEAKHATDYICGTRSMAGAAHEVASNELPEINNPTRNDKDEWSFVIHEVSASTEEVLNKGKLDASRSENAQKQCYLPENATTSSTMIENVYPHVDQEAKHTTDYICGTRSMAGAAHEVASNGLPETKNPTRNDKDEWSFAIHEVSATNEEVLNEGIVDKGKLEASRSENTQKKCYLPENATKSTTMIENVDPHAEQEAKHTTEYLLQEEPNKACLSKQYSLLNAGDLTALQPEAKKNDTSGSWRMSFAAHEVDCNELPETGNTEKNDREVLSCALCEVSASTEGALNESMYLKEQKCKFDTLRSENGGKCWLPKNATESSTITETVDPPAEQNTKLTTDYLLSKKTKEVDLRKPDSPPKAGDHSLQPETLYPGQNKQQFFGSRRMALEGSDKLPETDAQRRNDRLNPRSMINALWVQ